MSIAPSDEEQTVIVAGGGNVREDNTFVFDDISTGNYVITYLDPAPTFVQIPVSVGDSDVDGLILGPPSCVQVKGRIITDTTHADIAEVKISLRPATDRMVSPVFIATVNDNGLLTFEKPIPSGVYRVRVDTPVGCYVRSMFYGSTDVTHGLIDLSEGGGDMVIVTGCGTGALEVAVRQEEQQQSTRTLHYVVLQTETDAAVGKLYMTVTVDEVKAVLKNIPPGRYRAYAFRSLDAAAVTVPETLRRLKEFGSPVEVHANNVASAVVRVVPPHRAAEAFEGSAKSSRSLKKRLRRVCNYPFLDCRFSRES